MTPAERKRELQCKYQRDYRQRQREGRAALVVPIASLERFVTVLLDRGLLTDKQSRSRKHLNRMGGEILDEWTDRWSK